MKRAGHKGKAMILPLPGQTVEEAEAIVRFGKAVELGIRSIAKREVLVLLDGRVLIAEEVYLDDDRTRPDLARSRYFIDGRPVSREDYCKAAG